MKFLVVPHTKKKHYNVLTCNWKYLAWLHDHKNKTTLHVMYFVFTIKGKPFVCLVFVYKQKKQLNINIEMSHLQRSYFLILKIVVPYIQKLLIYFSISSVARSPGFFFWNLLDHKKIANFKEWVKNLHGIDIKKS